MPDPEPGTLRVHLDTRVNQRLLRQRADINGGVRGRSDACAAPFLGALRGVSLTLL